MIGNDNKECGGTGESGSPLTLTSRVVMERLREHKLYLRHEKCEFEKTRIEYLGAIISHNKVEMDPVKIAGVSEWPTPTNKKGGPVLHRFYQLLPTIHSELFATRSPPVRSHHEGR